MVKYRTSIFNDDIIPIEIDRESKKSVWVKKDGGRQRLKKGSDYIYHDVFIEAKREIVDRRIVNVEYCKFQLGLAEVALGNAREMEVSE